MFGETEALNLVEIFAREFGRDVECRGAGHRLVGQIFGDENRHVLGADADRVGRAFWPEFPRQVAAVVGIETDDDRLIGGDHGCRNCGIDAHGRSAKACYFAKNPVERDSSKADTDHRNRDRSGH